MMTYQRWRSNNATINNSKNNNRNVKTRKSEHRGHSPSVQCLILWLVLFFGCFLGGDIIVSAASTTSSSSSNSNLKSTGAFSSPPAFTSSKSSSPLPSATDLAGQDEDDDVLHISTINTTIPEWKQKLPYPLNNKTKTLQRIVVPGPVGRTVDVYLLGTAHVSTDSSRDVRLLLESLDPDVIFLELCDQRIPMLLTPPPPSPAPSPPPNTTPAVPNEQRGVFGGLWQRLRRRRGDETTGGNDSYNRKSDKNNNIRNDKSMYTMAASLLTNMQQDYAESLGVELGGEFRVAYDYWDNGRREGRRMHMILGDRPLYLTLTRAWESLRVWGKTKLVVGLLISSFQKPNPEELKEWMQSILQDDGGDLLTKSIAELGQHFPTLEEVIIQERDAYMACKLYQTCRHLLMSRQNHPNERYCLVAVVGAGHVEGICRWLTDNSPNNDKESPEDILSKLVQIKSKIPQEDHDVLVHDIMELNPEILRGMLNDDMEYLQQEQQQR